MKSIFEVIELSMKIGVFLSIIVGLLCYVCCMYCRGKNIEEDDYLMKIFWFKDWEVVKKYLKDVGYEDVYEYFICLSKIYK